MADHVVPLEQLVQDDAVDEGAEAQAEQQSVCPRRRVAARWVRVGHHKTAMPIASMMSNPITIVATSQVASGAFFFSVFAAMAGMYPGSRHQTGPTGDSRPEEDTMTEDDRPLPEHTAPDGVDDLIVEAVGLVTEALEYMERARGHLYSFHQLTGTGDLKLGKAVAKLREAGHHEVADDVEREILGRNVIGGRWTFQIVEDYDDTYWSPFRDMERSVRDRLVQGRRHLFEARMKEDRRTHGHPAHTARPDTAPA